MSSDISIEGKHDARESGFFTKVTRMKKRFVARIQVEKMLGRERHRTGVTRNPNQKAERAGNTEARKTRRNPNRLSCRMKSTRFLGTADLPLWILPSSFLCVLCASVFQNLPKSNPSGTATRPRLSGESDQSIVRKSLLLRAENPETDGEYH